MNKLTIIMKAAPLALLAVVMSGSAFAGPGNGNGPKDKGPKGEPQASVSVVTNCSLCDPDAYGYDPANYVNCDYSKSDPILYVSATITDETGDVYDPITLQLDVDATGLRRDKGGKDAWTGIGGEAMTYDSATGTWNVAKLHLCQLDNNIDGAKAASAIVNVMVTNYNASKDIYSSRCENTIVNEDPYDGIEDEDFVDQSNFDIKSLGIDCPDQP